MIRSIIKNSVSSWILILSMIFMFNCSKKDDPSTVPSNNSNTKKVIFKAEASVGSNITDAVYGIDASNNAATGLSGTNWTSPELSVPANAKNVSAGVNAIGSSASSTLRVEIYIDRVLKKSETTSGSVMSTNALFIF